MPDRLSQDETKLYCGEERFHETGIGQSLRLTDYWRWSGSMLLDNTQRGILVEFLVTAALGLHNSPRREWDGADVRLPSGTAIEVKSAAYVQSWEQSEPSTIRFGIAPRRGNWNAVTGEYEEREAPKRWADIYVFCVFRGTSSRECLDMGNWDFYAISTEALDQEVPQQKTIGLKSLERLTPRKCSFRDLRKVISDPEKEIKGLSYT